MFVLFTLVSLSFSFVSFSLHNSPIVGYFVESNSFLCPETKSVDELDNIFNKSMADILFCAVIRPVL